MTKIVNVVKERPLEKITPKIPCLVTMKKNAFVHVVARVKKTVPPHLKIVIRQKGIFADVSQSAIWLNLTFAEHTFSLNLIYLPKKFM